MAANNWSLSTGRAEATRQALVLSGLPAQRIARIEGVAETEPLIADNPADPRNRRISLLLLDGKGSSRGGGMAGSIRARPSVLPDPVETAAPADAASRTATSDFALP